MLTWATFREQIRRSILKDPTAITWKDEVLLDVCGWALDTFSAHTALATGISFPATGTTYALPEDVYENVEDAGLVYLQRGTSITYLPSNRLRLEDSSDLSYSEWPQGTLLLSSLPSGTSTLYVRYFATYPHPVADSDPILIPLWARHAVAHLIGAYAMTSVSVNAGNIRQWNTKQDSGTPIQNPLETQQKTLMELYERSIARVTRQDRQNYWKLYYEGR